MLNNSKHSLLPLCINYLLLHNAWLNQYSKSLPKWSLMGQKHFNQPSSTSGISLQIYILFNYPITVRNWCCENKKQWSRAAHQQQCANYFLTEDHWDVSDLQKMHSFRVITFVKLLFSWFAYPVSFKRILRQQFSWEFSHFYIRVIFVSVLQHTHTASLLLWDMGSVCRQVFLLRVTFFFFFCYLRSC